MYEFLVRALIFIAIFDGIRHNSIFHSFSILKEILTYSLLLYTLTELKFRIKNPIKYLDLVLFVLYLISVGTVLTIGNLNLLQILLHRTPPINPIALHVKTLNFFLLIFIFANYSRLSKHSFTKLVDYIVKISILYIVFSVVSYFVHLPFIIEFRPYVGRISSGYPTADSQSLAFTLLMLYFAGKEKIRFFTSKLLILTIGIIMQATTTGVATLGLIFFSFFFFGKHLSNTESYASFVKSLFIISIIVVFSITFIFTIVDKEIVDSFVLLLTAKSEFIIYYAKLQLLGIESETSDHFVTATYKVRQEEIASVMKRYNSPMELLIGKGTALASIIENQFGFVVRAYGFLGVFFYVLFYVGSLMRGWFNVHYKFMKVALVMLVLFLTSMSQITTYLFQIALAFSLAYNYVFSQSVEKSNE